MKRLDDLESDRELEDFLYLESIYNDEEEEDLFSSDSGFPDELDYEFDVDEYDDGEDY
jgi:hypothetical protein